jgi:hypothetical protein
MARMKPADNWGVNVEHLTPALYTQILRVIAGKEPPAKGQEATNDFWTLLPYFVLAGLGGVRNCELIRYKRGEPVLQWADILWNKNLIFIRHEVAKETRARDRKRYIPLSALEKFSHLWVVSGNQASEISTLLKHPSWTLEQVVALVRPFAITAGSSGCFQRADGIGSVRSLGQAFKCRESC